MAPSDFYRIVFQGLVSVQLVSIIVHPEQFSRLKTELGRKLNRLQSIVYTVFNYPPDRTYFTELLEKKNQMKNELKISFPLNKVDLLSWQVNIPVQYCDVFQEPEKTVSLVLKTKLLSTYSSQTAADSCTCPQDAAFQLLEIRHDKRESPPIQYFFFFFFKTRISLKSKIVKPFKYIYSSPMKVLYNTQEKEQGKATY